MNAHFGVFKLFYPSDREAVALLTSAAIAGSGGHIVGGNNGFGNNGGDGSPNGKEDLDR